MKCLVVLASCFVVIYGVSQEFQDKAMEKMAEIADKCIPEVKASDDDIGELMEKKTPSRKEGKCLLACFGRELGLMKNGKPSKEGAMAALESLKKDDADLYEKVVKVIEKCLTEMSKETEMDECELATKVTACTQKVAKEMGLDEDSLMG